MTDQSSTREIRVVLRFEIDDEKWVAMKGGHEPQSEDFRAYVLGVFACSAEMDGGAVIAVDLVEDGGSR